MSPSGCESNLTLFLGLNISLHLQQLRLGRLKTKNKFDSKCSIKIETNTRGHNTTLHAYEGVSFQQIDYTVEKAIYAHSNLQHKIKNRKSDNCQKCGEWIEGLDVCGECGEINK